MKRKILDLFILACILFLSFSIYYGFSIPGRSSNNQYINIFIYIIISLLLYYITFGLWKSSYISLWRCNNKKDITSLCPQLLLIHVILSIIFIPLYKYFSPEFPYLIIGFAFFLIYSFTLGWYYFKLILLQYFKSLFKEIKLPFKEIKLPFKVSKSPLHFINQGTFSILSILSKKIIIKVLIISLFFFMIASSVYLYYQNSMRTTHSTLNFDIPPKNLNQINKIIKKYKFKYILPASAKKWFKAKLEYKNVVNKVKIRLKGDQTQHIKGSKWSFRVQMQDGGALKGMKNFSIQSHRTRAGLLECVVLRIVRQHHLLAPRCMTVEVVINNKNYGVYMLEEAFSKELIESAKKRNGVILKWDESIIWASRSITENTLPNIGDDLDPHFLQKSIPFSIIFQYNKIQKQKNIALESQYAHLLKKLSLLKKKKHIINIQNIYDLESLNMFYVFTYLFQARHARVGHNKRFYYNPITGLLESIYFDGMAGDSRPPRLCPHIIFSVNCYKALKKISTPSYLNKMYDDNQQFIKHSLTLLQTENPDYNFNVWNDNIKQHAIQIQNLWSSDYKPESYFRAFAHKNNLNNRQLPILVHNIHELPLQIKKITYRVKKQDIEIVIVKNDLQRHEKNIFLSQTQTPKYSLIIQLPKYLKRKDFSVRKLKVHFSLVADDKIHHIQINRAQHYSDDVFQTLELNAINKNLKRQKFLIINQKNKSIIFKRGKWKIKDRLIFPKRFKVTILEGTQLLFSKNTGILSYSPLTILGTPDNPVELTALNKTWEGISVLMSKEKSLIKNVIIDKTSSLNALGLQMLGGINFYKTHVSLNNVLIQDNFSEDALNIISSTFDINNISFINIFSDALDFDFSEGKIVNSSFYNVKADGLDFSGSVIEVENINMSHIQDKGLSVGEASTIKAKNVIIDNSNIGFASKDSSSLIIENSSVTNSTVGFIAFIKKNVYGPAILKGTSIKLENVKEQFWLEEESSITLEGEEFKPNRKKGRISKLLYSKLN